VLIVHSCDCSIEESVNRLLDMNEAWNALMLKIDPVKDAAVSAMYVKQAVLSY
jgi:hypothetical protein